MLAAALQAAEVTPTRSRFPTQVTMSPKPLAPSTAPTIMILTPSLAETEGAAP